MRSFKNVFRYKFKVLEGMTTNIWDKIVPFGRSNYFPLQNLRTWLFSGRNGAVLSKTHLHQPTLNLRMLQLRDCFKEKVTILVFHYYNKALKHNQLQKRKCLFGSKCWRFALTFCWPQWVKVCEEAVHQAWMCGRGSYSPQSSWRATKRSDCGSCFRLWSFPSKLTSLSWALHPFWSPIS